MIYTREWVYARPYLNTRYHIVLHNAIPFDECVRRVNRNTSLVHSGNLTGTRAPGLVLIGRRVPLRVYFRGSVVYTIGVEEGDETLLVVIHTVFHTLSPSARRQSLSFDPAHRRAAPPGCSARRCAWLAQAYSGFFGAAQQFFEATMGRLAVKSRVTCRAS